MLIKPLTDSLLAILTEQPSIDEYTLLKTLQRAPFHYFAELDFNDSHALFDAHFIIFHALHKLRIELLQDKVGVIHIDGTKIQLTGYSASHADISVDIPLARYYLDLTNLHQDKQHIDTMLNHFWIKLEDYWTISDDHTIRKACELLEVSPDCDQRQLRRAFRQKLHQVHPDKGGSNEATRLINEAYQRLSVYLQSH